MNDKTAIQVSVHTRDHLRSLGNMGDTYDSIITMLLETCIHVPVCNHTWCMTTADMEWIDAICKSENEHANDPPE